MRDPRRRNQYKHVCDFIDKAITNIQKSAGLPEVYPGDMKFSDLKDLLINTGTMMKGISADRYTAMVISVAKGGTNEQDLGGLIM